MDLEECHTFKRLSSCSVWLAAALPTSVFTNFNILRSVLLPTTSKRDKVNGSYFIRYQSY